MSINGAPLIFGAIIPILLNLLLLIAFGVMIIYEFILLVRFLRAGTRAFNIYIEKNSNSFLNGRDNGEQQ